MTDERSSDDTRAVARGAGLAFLGRMGALMEPLSVILFARLYGAPTLGLFLLLWGYVQLAAVASDFAMTTALQRFIPSTKDEERTHAFLKLSLVLSITLSVILAGGLAMVATYLVPYINAEEGARGDLATIVQIYAWAIPLWCFIDVSTAAVRARRVFGPEMKVRVFYEQGLRLVAGVALFFLGFEIYGLFIAHLLALFIAGAFSMRLVCKHYEFGRMVRSPISMALVREALSFAGPMSVSNLVKRLHVNLPIFVLNLVLPGAAGATAVAVYTVARKVTSLLNVIRQSFEYVIAPLASASKGRGDGQSLGQMYAFATRLICGLFIPTAAGVILVRHEVVDIIGPEFTGAAIMILILTLGRAAEAATGPSAAMVEMIGRYRLPLINGIIGLVVSAILLVWLTPTVGEAGAAIATAVGINVTAWVSMIQIWRLYGHHPYDRRLIRPVLAGLMGAAIIWLTVYLLTPWGGGARFGGAVVALLAALFLLLRYGFSARDASVFGKLGRRIRN